MLEHHRGPGGPRHHRIEQRQQPALAVEYRQLHGQRIDLPHFHARVRVVVQALPVRRIQRSRLDQQAASDAAHARLLHQLLVERIHRVGRPGKLQVLLLTSDSMRRY